MRNNPSRATPDVRATKPALHHVSGGGDGVGVGDVSLFDETALVFPQQMSNKRAGAPKGGIFWEG